MRRRTPLSPGEISVVMSAAYQAYGAALDTELVGEEPTPSNVCQLKLPLVVVLKLRPKSASVARLICATPAVDSSMSTKLPPSSCRPPSPRNGSTNCGT